MDAAPATATATAPAQPGQQQQPPARHVPFEARLDNVKTMASMLAAIQSQPKVTCAVTGRGVRFSSDDSHSVQAFAYLQKSLFRDYRLDRDLRFTISLDTLLSCLNIFGAPASGAAATSVSLDLLFDEQDRSLHLVLYDEGVVTTCNLRTYQPVPPVDFGFRNSPIVNKVIIKSSWLKDAFDEMDGTSDKVNLLVAPASPYFRISTVGMAGSAEVDYPKTADVIETFQSEDAIVQSYRQSSFVSVMKALAISHKTSLRMNRRGFLHLMFMIQLQADTDELLFVEYFLAPVEPDAYYPGAPAADDEGGAAMDTQRGR